MCQLLRGRVWVELCMAVLSSVWLYALLDTQSPGRREIQRESRWVQGRVREREAETEGKALVVLLAHIQEGRTGTESRRRIGEVVAMEQPALSPSSRRRSDSSVRESLFFPVLERNEQERLEALMRRSLERNLQVDQRPKRWTWGGPPGACEGECAFARAWRDLSDGEMGKQGVGTALQPFCFKTDCDIDWYGCCGMEIRQMQLFYEGAAVSHRHRAVADLKESPQSQKNTLPQG